MWNKNSGWPQVVHRTVAYLKNQGWLPCHLTFCTHLQAELFNPWPSTPRNKMNVAKRSFNSKMKHHESIWFGFFTPVTGFERFDTEKHPWISIDFREISQHLNLSSCESHLFELFLHQNPSQFSTQTLTHPASQCLAGLATHLGDLLGNAEPWKQPATLCVA